MAGPISVKDNTRLYDPLVQERDKLTLELEENPYNLYLYLQRANTYRKLGYPDLTASDAYRALLLTDELLDEESEFCQQALDAIIATRDVGRHTCISGSYTDNEHGAQNDGTTAQDDDTYHTRLAYKLALVCYHIIVGALIDCGDLKSAYEFTQRGLKVYLKNKVLKEFQREIVERYERPQEQLDINEARTKFKSRNDLPSNGLIRRELYSWDSHEPDRSSEENLYYINAEMRSTAPKCEVRLTELPLLHDGPLSDMCEPSPVKQLGLFATTNIAPGEPVLLEPSVLTSSIGLHDPVCDACSAPLPSWSPEHPLPECSSCEDIVFCSKACLDRAQHLYHPAVCGITDFDVVAKDPSPFAATNALYTLLLARTIAMAETQNMHPLDLPQVKYLWGDFIDSATRTLPFTFDSNIAQPIHLLAGLGKDPFTTLARYDTWVINILLAKFRGTANAKMNERTGIPEVAGVHWLWSLGNHSCAPNVRWEWERGQMGFVARSDEEVIRWNGMSKDWDGDKNREGGIRAGQEVLNHYCDVELPVKERREWAVGALGGLCRCDRCLWEEEDIGK